MTLNELKAIVASGENERVEFTVSVDKTDKYGEAICAFSNDLSDSKESGIFIVGVSDSGEIVGLSEKDTEKAMQTIASIRSNGNIQPPPSFNIDKIKISEGKFVVVITVEPSIFTPVKYKGKISVRIGARSELANENDERRLNEKRASLSSTFDGLPCMSASFSDLDISQFRDRYLPLAVPSKDLEGDTRSEQEQLSAFNFYNLVMDKPTNAGVILFGKNPSRFLHGAYVQYVRFSGCDRAGEILSQYEFKKNLSETLEELDIFIKTTVSAPRPIPVSPLREEQVSDYPYWATRELLVNALIHREYDSNAPVQFYQYDDRIEFLNHGGLFGRVNSGNFPKVNDYRNPIVADAVRVLGFANRFSRGVARVEKELEENGNGKPKFDLSLKTAFAVTEFKSKRAENIRFNSHEYVNDQLNDQLNDKEKEVLRLISENEGKTAKYISQFYTQKPVTFRRHLRSLVAKGLVEHRGSKRNGGFFLRH